MTSHDKKFLYIILLMLWVSTAFAQERIQVGDYVQNTEVRDSKNNPVMLPYFGEKTIMIFYSDPDRPNRNEYLAERLKQEELNGDDFYGFGVVNLKDAPFFPNGLVRFMIRREEKKNAKHNVKIYTDPDHLLKNAWNFGDVNDQFAVSVISKEGEVLFYQEKELTENETEDFIVWLRDYLGVNDDEGEEEIIIIEEEVIEIVTNDD